MTKFGIFCAALLAGFPGISQAQVDPDWSRREVERMQAQQERWDAQAARQRAEQEREAARQSGSGTSAVAREKPIISEKMDGLSRPLTLERITVIFKVATDVCPVSKGPVPLNPHAYEDAISLMSDDESGLMLYFCGMYTFGEVAGEDATKRKRAKQ